MKVLGVIIAGGQSRRMGAEKAFVMLKGKTLLQHVVDRIAPQVDAVVVNANGDVKRFVPHHVIADQFKTGTPLAGLHVALAHAKKHGFDHVLTVPSDSPFLPDDLVTRLSDKTPAIARSGGQEHFITGLWPVTLLPKLESALQEMEVIRVQDWAASAGAISVEWPIAPHDPFMNINTAEDLALAEQSLS